MLDTLKVFAAQVQALLEPGEQPRFCALVAYFPGAEDLGVAADGPDVVDVVLDLPSARALRLADRVVTGTTLLGWPGCQSQQLSRTVLTGTQTQLLLTDRRLAVLDSERWTVLWQCPRSGLRRARRRWRLAQAGRVMVQLGDGSAVALVLGAVSARNARRFVAAVEAGP